MKEIYKLLEKRIENNEIFSNYDILDIVNWYLKENDLFDFLGEVRFIQFPNNYTLSWYDDKKLKLYINLYNLIDENLYKFRDNLSINSMNVVNYCNYSIIVAVFSGLNSIRQYRDLVKKDEFYKPIVSELYLCNKELKQDKNLYKSCYSIFPCERKSEIDSREIGMRCFQNIDSELLSQDELKVYQINFINSLISNYNGKFKIISPFEQLLVESNDLSVKGYINWLKSEYISLYVRLELGLPVSKKELKRIALLKKEVLKDKIKKTENIKELIIKRG